MDYDKWIPKLLEMGESGDTEALQDLFRLMHDLEAKDCVVVRTNHQTGEDTIVYDKDNFAKAHDTAKKIRAVAAKFVRQGDLEMLDLYKRCLLFDAPYYFDEFCRYIEFDREPEKKFYEPRRKQLLPIVQSLQDLADDKLDLLAISMPPGVGKTTTAIFYVAWMAGKRPELQNLICSHNNEFLRGVYDEVLRVTDPEGEYLWQEVFPKVHVVGTNAKGLRIDFGNRKRFETVECTARGSQNAGKVRATNLLYCDDLVSGIEEAMSNEQMNKLWQVYTDDFRQRKQGNRCKELHIATRWSVRDVIGRLEVAYEGDDRARFVRCPALDENDESLWDYPYGLGYDTPTLHEQREIMDDASWRALYMNEPVERLGTLYDPQELRRFFSLPEAEPDAVIAVCDIADGGGDYWAMPIVYQYGKDFYIEDWICDNGKPEIVEERIVEKLIANKVKMARFESNRGGGRVAETVQKMIKERNGITSISTKWNQTDKATRIIVNSPWVKEHCLFKNESEYSKEYRQAMTMLTGYTMMGKNAHDDIPDSMSDLADFVQGFEFNVPIILRRPF